MKTLEDEAFDELTRKQGAWGGWFKAKQAMVLPIGMALYAGPA